MKNHVKLEIAIQKITERIAKLYDLRNKTSDQLILNEIDKQLKVFYDQKDKVLIGDLKVINEILNVEDGGK